MRSVNEIIQMVFRMGGWINKNVQNVNEIKWNKFRSNTYTTQMKLRLTLSIAGRNKDELASIDRYDDVALW